MRQRYYKQKRIKKLFVVHQRGNAYEKEIFENMYQCFGSNGSLAKRMRRSAAEKRREDNDGDCKTGGYLYPDSDGWTAGVTECSHGSRYSDV